MFYFCEAKERQHSFGQSILVAFRMIVYKSMSRGLREQEITCCLCKTVFEEPSQPRMMPYCEHSSCTPCLRQFLKTKELSIICQHCGHEESVAQANLQYFPKNISLSKQLRERAKLPTQLEESSRDTISSANASQTERDYCEEHKKDLEIICINDRVKLCPHCALFGSHKDHKFKTIREVQQLMAGRAEEFRGFRVRKQALDMRTSSNEFKEGIIRKISQEKDRLISEIKKKFGQISQNVRLAEKKAYEDVVKNFKIVYGRISTLIKEENDSHKKYRLWELKCTDLFQKAQKMTKIQQKVALYCDGPLQICSEGSSLLNRLQSKINNNIASIQNLISQIKIIQNPGVSNSVFNYINVILEDSQETDSLQHVPQQILSPRSFKEDMSKQTKIQFSADHLASQRHSLSPIPKKKSKEKDIPKQLGQSQKRSSCKSVSSPQRNSVDCMIQQFCQRENLDTLDLTGYSLSDYEIIEILTYLRGVKRIKGLKLVKNKLSNEGLGRILQLIPAVTNLNLAFNQLGDQALTSLLNNRPRIPSLRIINLSNNKINERKTKNAIEQLKKQGLIVTI